MLIVIGTRPDGSPIEAECRCQIASRKVDDLPALTREILKRHRQDDREAPDQKSETPPAPSANPPARTMPDAAKTKRPAFGVRQLTPVERKAGGSTVLLGGLALALFLAAVAGFLAKMSGHGADTGPVVKTAVRREPATEVVGEPASSLPGGVEVRNDASGVATQVSGFDASAVLRAFCRHPQFKSTMVPGALQSIMPPDPNLLIGSAVLMDGAGTPCQLILRRDPNTKRWSIGDGNAPIMAATP